VKWFVRLLAGAVRRSPWGIIAGTLIVTLVLGVFMTQQQTATGNEGFSPNTPEFRAEDVISSYFSQNSEQRVQVVVTAKNGDLLTADGLRDYLAIRDAISSSEAGQLLKNGPDNDIVGYFDPLVQGLQMRADQMGVPFDTLVGQLTDEQVKQGFLQAYGSVPVDTRALLDGLFGKSSDLAVPSAQAALMVVTLHVSDLNDPDQTKLQAIEVNMADAIAQVPTVASKPVAFSFALLFADNAQVQSEIGRLFGEAFLIIVLILMFVYWIHPKGRLTRGKAIRRSIADMGLTMLVIVMSIVWMNGIGVLLGPKYLNLIGKFNEILQILPILLIGLGVDYAIHLTSRYREELGAGISVPDSAVNATRTVGIALILATVTTSVGFLTNVVNPVTALRDFGVLAAVGISSAFLLMLTVVPAVRVLLDSRGERAGHLERQAFGHQSERVLPKIMGSTAVLAEKYAVSTLIAALALGVLGFVGLTRLDTTFSFTDFLPKGNVLLKTYDTIVAEFSGGFGEQTNVIIEGDVATPEVYNGIVAAWANLADTPDVVQLGSAAAAESPVSVIAQMITPGSDSYNQDFATYAAQAGLQQDLTVASGTDVAALYDQAAAANAAAMARVVAKVDGSYHYVDVAVTTQAGEQRANELSANLKADFAPVIATGATAVPTNQNIISAGVVTALQNSQKASLTITILAAMVLLVITFWIESRRPFLGVITILPVALVVLWVFGIMAARGISFNPITATIANLAIGIGVPYTIHITHRYQEDRLRLESPEEAIRSTTTHTGGALAGSAFTTAAGFGILVTSTLKPFQQFGEVTFWAITFALVASVLVLPSMLVLWDRWHRRRGEAIVDSTAFEHSRI
jgi:predicted RND superfamily exporter protein